VPTTILALQHYKTFKNRLASLPCKVDYINRFKSAKQQKETIEKLSETQTESKNLIENLQKNNAENILKIKNLKEDLENKQIEFSNKEKTLLSEYEQNLEKITQVYKESFEKDLKQKDSIVSSGLFYMEKQLEDFIIENWNETPLGDKYDLIYEEGVLKSQQFQTPIGRIDILAKSKSNDTYVVIEL
jgi:RecG-like helicase